MADAGHVFGTMATPETRLVLLELDIEHPMQAVFNAPMGARRLREGFGRQDPRRDIAAPFGFAFATHFDTRLDHGDGAEALEARLIGIAPLAAHPVNALGDEMAARLDAAMGFFRRRQNLKLMARSAVKIELDLGMGGFLVVFRRQKIVAAEIDDGFGNIRLATHGID